MEQTNNNSHRLNGTARDFVLAGNARFTISNPDTGARFTYRVRKGDGDAPYFVSVLTGPDNDNAFTYLGCIFDGETFRVTARSKIGKGAPSAVAFDWTWPRLGNADALGPVEIWHEGRCGRCGRALTVPESIASGIGPVCATQAGN